MEEHGDHTDRRVALRCSNPDCLVLPEAPSYVTLKEACRGWVERVEDWEELLDRENVCILDLDVMQRYGIAKRFYIGAATMLPLSIAERTDRTKDKENE